MTVRARPTEAGARSRRLWTALLVYAACGTPVAAQQPRIYTVDDVSYAPGAARFVLEAPGSVDEPYTIEYQVNGGELTEYSAPLQFGREGRYRVDYWAIGAGGERSAVGWYDIIIDDTPPTLAATARGPAIVAGGITYLRPEARLIVRADDAVTPDAELYASRDGVDYRPSDGTIELARPGRHTVYLYAVDAVGNRSEVLTISAVVDTTGPVTRVIPRRPLRVIEGRRISDRGNQFILVADDEAAGVEAIFYRLNDAPETRYLAPIVLDEPGSHELLVRAVDRVGNSGDTFRFSVDVTPE